LSLVSKSDFIGKSSIVNFPKFGVKNSPFLVSKIKIYPPHSPYPNPDFCFFNGLQR